MQTRMQKYRQKLLDEGLSQYLLTVVIPLEQKQALSDSEELREKLKSKVKSWINEFTGESK